MADLVVVAFPSEEKAEEVRTKLLEMQQGWRRPAVPTCSRSALTGVLGAAAVALALAGCANTGGSVATAQSPHCDNGMLCGESLDKDQDGQISASEWSATFRSMDTDGDGVVSQSEFQAAGGQWGGGGGHGR